MVRIEVRKPAVHTFDKSFEEAKVYETELDKHFGLSFDIVPATREQERMGIDRFFEHRASGVRYSVEYKTDHLTAETGNVFVETVSVDAERAAGWAYTSLAQVLVYYVPEAGYAMRADMTEIKRRLPAWERCRQAAAWNRSRDGSYYRTLGRLMPASEFREACVEVHDVAAPLDAGDWRESPAAPCHHDLPREVCNVCNGTVRRMIAGSAS